MKNFSFGVLVFATLFGNLRAQQLDNPVAIPVAYWGAAPLSGTSGSFSFGTSVDTLTGTNGTGSIGVFINSPLVTAWVTPGKEYQVPVTAAGVYGVFAHIQPVAGCDIYINNYKQTTFSAFSPNNSFTLRVEKINDLTQGLAGKRGGQCSSFPEDKPIWYVGLGSLRDGKFAGAVGFRADTITSDLYTTALLIYDSVDTSEVSVTRDGSGHITNIVSRDVR